MKILYIIIIPIFYSFLPKPNNHNLSKSEKKIVIDTDRYYADFDNLLGFYRDTNYLFWEDKTFICFCGLCYLNNENTFLNISNSFDKEKIFSKRISTYLKWGYLFSNEKLLSKTYYIHCNGIGYYLQESLLLQNDESYHVFFAYIYIDHDISLKLRLCFKGKGDEIRHKVYKMLISFKIKKYNKNGSITYLC